MFWPLLFRHTLKSNFSREKNHLLKWSTALQLQFSYKYILLPFKKLASRLNHCCWLWLEKLSRSKWNPWNLTHLGFFGEKERKWYHLILTADFPTPKFSHFTEVPVVLEAILSLCLNNFYPFSDRKSFKHICILAIKESIIQHEH